VRIRAYDLRSNAQEALFRVQMLTDDETLAQTAETVLTDITATCATEHHGTPAHAPNRPRAPSC
jgi:hypothetical protein